MPPKTAQQNLLFGKFEQVMKAVVSTSYTPQKLALGSYFDGVKPIRYVDMFCGIGGFHAAADSMGGMECVFACDIDDECRKAYEANYGLKPESDICRIDPKSVPDHDLMFAGFPCQPFSIIGSQEGFADARGTLFFELAKIIEAKRPMAFVLENVKQLKSHNNGKTLARILEILRGMGYTVDFKIFNALHFGLPQKRERILIVGFRDEVEGFAWPDKKIAMKPLSEILESKPADHHYVSERIKKARLAAHKSKIKPSIWHENKAGNISSHPYSCALRAGASYNYLLVNGERRLTSREMLRLQGFPESFKIVCAEGQMRKQAGNAVPVPMVKSVIQHVLHARRANSKRNTKAA
jgi:DNA (cytosine-5)-methyltransferase 1